MWTSVLRIPSLGRQKQRLSLLTTSQSTILKLTWKTDEFWILAYRAKGSWRKYSNWKAVALERLSPAWRVASPKLHRQLQLTSQPILPSTSLCSQGRIVYQWLGRVVQVRVHDPLHPCFFDGMSTVTKFCLDGLLQVGTDGLMQTAAVLRVRQQ